MELYLGLSLLVVFFMFLKTIVEKKRLNSTFLKSVLTQGKTLELKAFNGPLRLPIIGSALQFLAVGGTHNLYDAVQIFCKRYGSVNGSWVGSRYFIFIYDPVVGRDMLNHEDLTRKFPATSITYDLYGPLNLGISQAHGDVLKEMRRFASRGLKRYGFGKFASMDNIVQKEISTFLTRFENSRQAGNGVVNMNEVFYIPTLNVLWRLMTNETFTQDDHRLIRIIEQARDVLKKDQIGSVLPFAFTIIAHIPGLTPYQNARTFWKEIRALLGEILERRKAAMRIHKEPECLMDLYCQEIEPGVNPMYTDGQCVQTCMDLFLAGLDSTANTLDWMVIYLVTYPTVYAKVMQEIGDVIGYNQLPLIQHKAQMPYTECFMLEVLRIANVIAFTMRAPIHETSYDGYRIPANSHVVVNLDAFHKSKEVWGDPEIFRPERFLGPDSKIINSEKIFSFGFGKRACIGELSSKMSLFLFLTTFLQQYTLSVSPFHPAPSLIPERGILISHPLPYHLKATMNPAVNYS